MIAKTKSQERDWHETEDRNDGGYPHAGPITRPRAHIEPDASVGGNLTIDQKTDNSVNRPMPWIALAMLLAGFSVAVSVWAISEARDTRTQLLLLREDIRQMTIEAAKHTKD